MANGNRQRCSMSLIVREMQVKATVRRPHTCQNGCCQETRGDAEGLERGAPSTAGGCTRRRPLRERLGRFSNNVRQSDHRARPSTPGVSPKEVKAPSQRGSGQHQSQKSRHGNNPVSIDGRRRKRDGYDRPNQRRKPCHL